jgi:hypothetical protein
MLAMLGTRATIPARLHWASMPTQDCLFIRLSGYLEARRLAPAADQAPDVIAGGQALIPEKRDDPSTKALPPEAGLVP